MQERQDNSLRLAACAVAVAAAMGGGSLATAADSQAVDQLQRYCTTSWRNAGIDRQAWEDCTQQALMELLERISRDGLTRAIENSESDERRELNRSVWRTVQRWRRRAHVQSLDSASVAERPSRNDAESEAWSQIELAAPKCLSDRQRQILELTRDGWRVSEIADELSLTAARVSDEKYKAIHKLRDHLGVA